MRKTIILIFYSLILTCWLLEVKTALSKKQGLVLDTSVPGFYPDSPTQLQKMISNFWQNARPLQNDQDLKILLVPHAGYVYSGQVAIDGYSSLHKNKNTKTVVLIGPAHKETEPLIALPGTKYWKTPLGKITINQKLTAKIRKKINPNHLLENPEKTFANEHSLNVQLPMLQKALTPGFKLVPILINTTDYSQELALAIASVLKNEPNVLTVISTDLSHYHQVDIAEKKDAQTIKIIKKLDPHKFITADRAGSASACGSAAIATSLFLANLWKCEFAQISYSNSGYSGKKDKSRVVGYLAGAFLQPQPKALSVQDAVLKKVNQATKGRTDPVSPASIFVTLKTNGKLRGCVANSKQGSLDQAAQEAAKNALQDSRFKSNRLKHQDLQNLEIEISILSKRRKVQDPINEIVIGRHGVRVEKNNRSAFYLPEVAVEQGWNIAQTLKSLSEKAGLKPHEWLNDANIEIFTTEKIFNSPTKAVLQR